MDHYHTQINGKYYYMTKKDVDGRSIEEIVRSAAKNNPEFAVGALVELYDALKEGEEK